MGTRRTTCGFGVYADTPYAVVDQIKLGDKTYALVRIIDGTDNANVRCIQSEAALPKQFSVGAWSKIVSLSGS